MADVSRFLQGNVFTFATQSTELMQVLSRFYRHSNIHSFVRQLNICEQGDVKSLSGVARALTRQLAVGPSRRLCAHEPGRGADRM